MHDFFINIARTIQSFPVAVSIILLVVVSIAKLIIAVRQIYAQEAAENGFALGSVITGWAACIAVAIYSITVFKTTYLTIGLIALVASFVLGILAKSVKMSVLDVCLFVLFFFSGIFFGVIGDKAFHGYAFFGIDIALIGELALDFILGAIAVKLGDKAPNQQELLTRKVSEKLLGINKEYFALLNKELPELNDAERYIISACSYADAACDADLSLDQRTWIAGSVLWVLSKKSFYKQSDYTLQAKITDSKVNLVNEYDKVEAAKIRAPYQYLNRESKAFANPVMGMIDFAVEKENKDNDVYLWNAVSAKIMPQRVSDYTDDYIEKRNNDIKNEEYVKAVVSDLRDFFVGAIDLRNFHSDSQKIAFLKSLSYSQRYAVLYGVLLIAGTDITVFTDPSEVRDRITRLEAELLNTESSASQRFWTELNRNFENLGTHHTSCINTVLKDWNRYRSSFSSAMNLLR